MGTTVVALGVLFGTGIALCVLPRAETGRGGIRRWLDNAGLAGVPVPVVAIVLGTLSLVSGALAMAVVPLPVIAPLGAIVGASIPVIGLLGASDSRQRRARTAWPDVIDGIRMSVRSGSTLDDALVSVSSHIPREWRTAWANLESDLRRGADAAPALRRLQRALADPIADRVIESILVTREFGGTELPSVLAELARTIRRDQALRSEASSRQSWVRHAATLGVVAPWVVLALLASRPENREVYASSTGTIVIVASAGATAVAYAVMMALGTLRAPRRWLTRSLRD